MLWVNSNTAMFFKNLDAWSWDSHQLHGKKSSQLQWLFLHICRQGHLYSESIKSTSKIQLIAKKSKTKRNMSAKNISLIPLVHAPSTWISLSPNHFTTLELTPRSSAILMAPQSPSRRSHSLHLHIWASSLPIHCLTKLTGLDTKIHWSSGAVVPNTIWNQSVCDNISNICSEFTLACPLRVLYIVFKVKLTIALLSSSNILGITVKINIHLFSQGFTVPACARDRSCDMSILWRLYLLVIIWNNVTSQYHLERLRDQLVYRW